MIFDGTFTLFIIFLFISRLYTWIKEQEICKLASNKSETIDFILHPQMHPKIFPKLMWVNQSRQAFFDGLARD